MSNDLFPTFTSEHIQLNNMLSDTAGPAIFVRTRVDRDKPPLLLLHGYPQTYVEFHKIVPRLLSHFSLFLLDLRGYGASSTVLSENGSGYSKRLMAQDCVSVMRRYGYEKFSILGHDRGAGVAYRLALDMPEKVDKLIIVDIIPTYSRYTGFADRDSVLRGFHWSFMAQAEPFPETMIKGADGGKFFLEHILTSWSGTHSLEAFDPTPLENYREAFCNDERIHSTCEDYRAGAFHDRAHDEDDLKNGNKIGAQTLIVWGQKGRVAGPSAKTPLDVWRDFAEDVRGVGLECGHFIPEEDPDGLVDAVMDFFGIKGR
ncbi:hypothetical protein H072_9854 [Dactylellina haptotyla CBS 200.50]|uniref:AB hydrolase-1 domain-containing protein n=1 Tax=Dactylellina haptotyla (strain CBS 200.50) TaxID=1284197 RepID=S8BBQ0_DACHA|nr:hypothetical protein H072_9854 [Dactylellina haptotyla CBS 200.50]